ERRRRARTRHQLHGGRRRRRSPGTRRRTHAGISIARRFGEHTDTVHQQLLPGRMIMLRATLLLLATLTAASARADVTGSYDGTLTPKKADSVAASAVFTQTDTALTGTIALPADLANFGGAYIVQGKATPKKVKVTGVAPNGVTLKYRGKIKGTA